MAEIFVEPLDQVKLSEVQSAWLNYAYPLGDRIEEADVARALGDKLPVDFNPYRDINYFWTTNRLTIFGRYKVNPNDELLIASDKIAKALRDKFVNINSKKSASVSELVEETGLTKEIITRVLTGGYFYEFWQGENDEGRINYDQKLGENVIEFPSLRDYQKIKNYVGLKEQIEKQWQFAHRQIEVNKKESLVHQFNLQSNNEKDNSEISLGSDTPQTNPEKDAFGYSISAKRIAEIIQKNTSPKGLVMAIHGPWGSGKTTVLNFVKHYLGENDPKVVIINFNPWWFSNHENLAAQFLSQFNVHLKKESEVLKKIGEKLAEYSDAIGSVIANTYGIPWLDKIVGFYLKLLKQKPKEVQKIKTEIAELLEKSGQRFLFIIDDIDRLEPNEVKDLFKVIKALADFPNVIYLLSFDREEISKSIGVSLNVDGETYLEKIVQVPINLPLVDKQQLRKRLFEEIDKIFGLVGFTKFDEVHWGNVYFGGLDNYLNKPRDIVRIKNALLLKYPAVVGEVNSVDFIAIEFLRLFEPNIFEIIKNNKDMFTGYYDSRSNWQIEPERKFHNSWLEAIPQDKRLYLQELLKRLFPKLNGIWGQTFFGSESAKDWRKELRICSSDNFDIYFKFGLEPINLGQSELKKFLLNSEDPEITSEKLIEASKIKHFDGSSKARDYLDRIRELNNELNSQNAIGLAISLLNVGDFILSSGDEPGGFTSIPNRWRLWWTIESVIERIPLNERAKVLEEGIRKGNSITLGMELIDRALDEKVSKEKRKSNPFDGIQKEIEPLKGLLVKKSFELDFKKLLELPQLSYVLFVLESWASKERVKERILNIVNSDEYLPMLMEGYLSFGTSHSMGDRVGRRIPQIDPKIVEHFVDRPLLTVRLKKILKMKITDNQKLAIEKYLEEIEKNNPGFVPTLKIDLEGEMKKSLDNQ